MSQGTTNLVLAIAQNEGAGLPGTVPTIANNPTAITSSNSNGVGYGVANSAGVVNYGSVNDGMQAGVNQVNLINSGNSQYYPAGPNTTVSQLATTWTGGDPNAANNYSQALGVSPNTPIGSIIDGTTPTKTPQINLTDTQPPGQKVALSSTGSMAPAQVAAEPVAVPYSKLTNYSSNIDPASLTAPIVVVDGLNVTPWFENPGLIVGNPRLRKEVQPVSFQVMLHNNKDFLLSTGGETGTPIKIKLNASMKSMSWSMKHIYHHQRTRTAHHITMWGMQADTIEGQCTTGVFMNQFGLTDYYSTRTINDNLKTLVGMLFNESVAQGVITSSATTPGVGGFINPNAAKPTENLDFNSIMNAASQNNPPFMDNTAFRVAAQDAFMEFLALFKMNGSVWFWNQLYDDTVGSSRDWVGIQAWSPSLGMSSAQKNARNNDVLTRGGVLMSYRNFVYQGYFKTLQWTMDAHNPFKWDFNFVFQVEKTVGQQFIPDR